MAQRRENRRKSSLVFPYEPDSERGRFIRFMDESGVTEVLIEAFNALYNEPTKPEDPIEWMRQYFQNRATQTPKEARAEVERLRGEIIQVVTKTAELKRKLSGGAAPEVEITTPPSESPPAEEEAEEGSEVGEEEEEQLPEPAAPLGIATSPALVGPDGEPLVDHSTETSPQASRFSFGGEEGEEEHLEEQEEEGAATEEEEEEEARNPDEDHDHDRRSSISSTRKSRHKSSRNAKAKSTGASSQGGGKRSGKKKRGGRRSSGASASSVKSGLEVNVGYTEEEEEEKLHCKEGQDHPEVPGGAETGCIKKPGAGALTYNLCTQKTPHICIGADFWTRSLSLGRLEPEDEEDLLFFAKFVAPAMKPEEKSKSGPPDEEFGWLPSILDQIPR